MVPNTERRYQRVIERYRELQARRASGESPEVGFTLIELLIVIVVLGILAAIVIFSLTGVTGESKAAACNADAKTVETAVSAYQAENSAAPVSYDNLTTAAGDPSGHGPYLHSKPSATLAANGYTVQMANGVVSVTTSAGTKDYDSTNLCTGL